MVDRRKAMLMYLIQVEAIAVVHVRTMRRAKRARRKENQRYGVVARSGLMVVTAIAIDQKKNVAVKKDRPKKRQRRARPRRKGLRRNKRVVLSRRLRFPRVNRIVTVANLR